MSTIQMQRLKELLQLVYEKVPELKVNKSPFKDSSYIQQNKARNELINLTSGVSQLQYTDTKSGEEITKFSGGQLNQFKNKAYVGFGLHQEPATFEFCKSHIELTYCEDLQSLEDGLNTGAMDHLFFYIIFEINEKDGKGVKILKRDKFNVCQDMMNYTWKDVSFSLRRNKDYPIGILNEQKTHDSPMSTERKPSKSKKVRPRLLSRKLQLDLLAG